MTFPEGWLRDQIAKSSATLDGLPPEVRDALAHRTRADRETIARALVRDAYMSSIDDARDIADEVVDLATVPDA
jgi:hypothetical protein